MKILRDDELEPYRGTAIYVRSAGCGLVYAALLGVFSLLAARGVIRETRGSGCSSCRRSF